MVEANMLSVTAAQMASLMVAKWSEGKSAVAPAKFLPFAPERLAQLDRSDKAAALDDAVRSLIESRRVPLWVATALTRLTAAQK